MPHPPSLSACLVSLPSHRPTACRTQVTRVYDRVEAKASPSPPGSFIARYARLDAPPPLAPSPAVEYVFSPPPPPHKDVMFTCEFTPGVEVSVDTDVGYTDMQVVSQQDCCQQCGLKDNCQDFVFQPESKICMLLPHVPADQLQHTANPYTVAGTVKLQSRPTNAHHHCTLHPATTYTGGLLPHQPGEAATASGRPLETEQDCCDACFREPACAKFTFQPQSKDCYVPARRTRPRVRITLHSPPHRSCDPTEGAPACMCRANPCCARHHHQHISSPSRLSVSSLPRRYLASPDARAAASHSCTRRTQSPPSRSQWFRAKFDRDVRPPPPHHRYTHHCIATPHTTATQHPTGLSHAPLHRTGCALGCPRLSPPAQLRPSVFWVPLDRFTPY